MASSVESPPAPADETSVGPDGLSSQDVRTRAVRGATMFVGRDVLVQFIGFATGLVLARLLTPADFGITTLGLTIVGAANVIADGGIAASLISRAEPPTIAELRAVNGFQLALTLAITAIGVPIGFALGGDGPATAIILLALPMYAIRTPPMLLFERRLQFGPRIIIQVAELVTYGVVAIALALAGLGVWAMPLALVARATAGTFYCYALSPTKWVIPTLRFRHVKPLLGFGVRFQLKSIVQLGRDVATVSLVGTLGGFQYLGFYGFCVRLLQIPKTVATALGEVTFPAFSRLIGNGEDVGPVLKRTTMTSSLMNALTIAPLVAASPALISFFFGHRWTDASLALPGLGIGLIIGGPLGWNIVNYLYATGDARTPLIVSGLLNAIATIAFVAAGIHFFGLVGLGMGVAAGQLVTTPQLLLRVQRRGGPNLWRACLTPVASAGASMALGWWVGAALHQTLIAGIAALSTALALQIALIWITDRSALRSCYSTLRRAVELALPAAITARFASRAEKKRRDPRVDQRNTMTAHRLTAFTEHLPFPRFAAYRDGRRVRYPRERLMDRLRASTVFGSVRRGGDLRRHRLELRYAAGDLGHSVRNRNWLIRVACAAGAIGLMFLLLSSSGSPATQGPTLNASDPGAASTSSASAQGAVTATPAQPAASAPAARGDQATATHRARHAHPTATHHAVVTHTPVGPVTHTPAAPVTHTPSATHTTPHTPSTPTKPATPKHTTSNPPKQAAPPTNQPAANPCTSGAVGCGGGLVFGDGPTTLATAPAIGLGSYQSVATGATTLSQIVSRFGAPLSTGAVRNFIGAGAYAGLIGAQPSGDSCAYYLDSGLRTTRAFQLCFNGAHELTQKAVISTSGGGSSGTS